MQKYIIAHGWDSEVEVIEAASLYDALTKAKERSLIDGIPHDDLDDATWAEPYTDELAHEVGLLHFDEDGWRHRAWRAEAPWR